MCRVVIYGGESSNAEKDAVRGMIMLTDGTEI
jgi:hypothetical protein